jgi:hypothetical protein
MKHAKHTPGPWTVNPDDHTEVLADGREPMNTVIANVPVGMPNARLIAAAPEMLEVLIKVMPFLDSHYHSDELALCRKAITKATGGEE